MKRSDLKYWIGIALMICLDSLVNLFFLDDRKFDLYLFYDHSGRYLDNIMFDFSKMFKFSLMSYWLIRLNRRIFKPLFYLSLLVWVSYFATYNQLTSLLILPIYAVLIYYFNKKKL